MRLARAFVLAALTAFGMASAPARAEIPLGSTGINVTLTPTVATDYLFRGISQTRNRWAGQFGVEAVHESGLYVGGFISNVAFQGTNARQEVDAYGGFRFTALTINWDVGAILYTYPGYTQPSTGPYDLNFFEVALRASREFGPVKLLAGIFYSPDYQLQSGNSLYIEGGIDLSLPFEFTASGRLGYITIQNNLRYGVPDYLWYSVGISRPLPLGFTAAVGWYGTNISQSDCVGGQKICDGRVLFTLSRPF
jgi:uncharacterized protein (TIGR02001 family)